MCWTSRVEISLMPQHQCFSGRRPQRQGLTGAPRRARALGRWFLSYRRVHVRDALEFQRIGRADSEQARSQADGRQHARFDLLVNLFAAYKPVVGKFSDRDVRLLVRLKIV